MHGVRLAGGGWGRSLLKKLHFSFLRAKKAPWRGEPGMVSGFERKRDQRRERGREKKGALLG